MSQRALAEPVGVTAAYITMLERGKKTNPSLLTLRRLAKALGVPLTELLGRPACSTASSSAATCRTP